MLVDSKDTNSSTVDKVKNKIKNYNLVHATIKKVQRNFHKCFLQWKRKKIKSICYAKFIRNRLDGRIRAIRCPNKHFLQYVM